MAKDTEKLIRQLSLISYLMAERRPVTATEIRRDVEGYSDMTEDAFARRFYADRAELDALGIHLSVDRPADGFSEQENYSLAPEAFHLRAIAFTDDERAALQTALSLLGSEFAYAEPLRLALQQITWGLPSPLGGGLRQRIGLGITASAGGADLSARLAKIDTAIYRRKRIEFEYFSMQRDERRARKVDPYHLLFEGGQWYLVGWSHDAKPEPGLRVFRLSRVLGKVAYATKAEHDFQRPSDFDPRRYANRIPWQLGETVGRAEVWVSEDVSWYVERQFGAYGELRDNVFHTDYANPRLIVAWTLALGEHARVLGPPELVEEARERADRIVEAHRGDPPELVAAAPRPEPPAEPRAQRPRPRRRRRDPPRAVRPAGHARVAADRRRPGRRAAADRRGLRPAQDVPAGAARGHRGAQRRQLRRRRLRHLRRGPAVGRDRGRPGAVLGHVRPPGAAAADRGEGARGRDRPAQPGAAGARQRARQGRRGARARPGRGGPADLVADGRRRGRAHGRALGARAAAARARVLLGHTRTATRTGRSSPTRSSTVRRRTGTSPPTTSRRGACSTSGSTASSTRPRSTSASSRGPGWTRSPRSAAGRAPAGSRARRSRASGSRPSRPAGRARSGRR